MERMSADRPRTAITWTAVLFLVTFVHHVYGGLRFDSPERIVLAVVFSAVFAVTYLAFRLGSTTRWARATFWFLVYAFWVAAVGLFEGGFNHALFAVLRLLDAQALVNDLYPVTGDARISDDLLFQGTGVLTLVAAVVLAVAPAWSSRRPTGADGRRPATDTGAR
ncbi:hypothetical protein [Micromonospora andamanensis]|uniref:hypothetical protein n=1 Tax=Micromonospora andamanensis TaxID=1287068 RepID=UPI00194DE120|nr:hypothetical protein [Micromonospora andamanensis]GIJ39773.1 hypothetical protein Vwe01_30980 [Micromonospora andamanensis]